MDALAEAHGRHKRLLSTILIDHSRGMRGYPFASSVNMLRDLLADVRDYVRGDGRLNDEMNPELPCSVYLFRSPSLTTFLQRVLPGKFKEIIGLQHMKLFVVDDLVCISG